VGQPEVGQPAHWFLATSTGLAPFHSMLSVAARTGDQRRFRLLFGCRDEGDVFGVERLEYFKSVLDFEYTICLSGPNAGPSYAAGRITAHLPTLNVADQYYLCGNGMMIAEARENLKAAGLDRKRIHFEKYW
jgi:ferredoxin-NADP reductase